MIITHTDDGERQDERAVGLAQQFGKRFRVPHHGKGAADHDSEQPAEYHDGPRRVAEIGKPSATKGEEDDGCCGARDQGKLLGRMVGKRRPFGRDRRGRTRPRRRFPL